TIAFAGDTDSFTLAVDPGQTITVLVTPAPTSPNNLLPTVSLFDPSSAFLGSATAPAALQKALLQTIPTTTGGTYTITVGGSGATTGLYTVRVTLNAALEDEANNGPTNNTLASAQNLAPSFISLGGAAGRAAVLGVTDVSSGNDFYSLTLAAGDTVTLA